MHAVSVISHLNVWRQPSETLQWSIVQGFESSQKSDAVVRHRTVSVSTGTHEYVVHMSDCGHGCDMPQPRASHIGTLQGSL
jgi:hypothetical protein